MPKIKYEEWSPKEDTLKVVAAANDIIESYAAQGYDLTLRQLYYQFVSRDLIRLVSSNVRSLLDVDAWEAKLEEEREGRRLLAAVSQQWDKICDHVRGLCVVDDIEIIEPDDFEDEEEEDADDDA